MPRTVRGPDGVTHRFPDNATDAQISEALASLQKPVASAPVSAQPRSMLSTAKEIGKGALKGVAGTVAGLGEMAAAGGMIPGVRPAQADIFNSAMRHPMFTRAEEMTTAQNTPQMVGKGLEAVAEMALPTGAAANAIPRAARAAGKFQQVMGAAKNIPIDPEAAGQVGLRIMQLAERGGTMPRPVTQFLQWVTNPERAPMTYEVARDFASNISRLSANEMQRLTPVMAREVAELRVVLNKAVGEAANKAGKGREYAEAMTEYAKAMKLRGVFDDILTGAKQAAPYAGVAGAAAWGANKLMGK